MGKHYTKAIFTEVTGSRELVVELKNASTTRNLVCIEQLLLNGKTTNGIDLPIIKPGETAKWTACKGAFTAGGPLIFTAFKIKGTDSFTFLGNESPWSEKPNAWSDIYKDSKLKGGLKSFSSTYESKAHQSHQISKNESLHGTINCFDGTVGVVLRYVFMP